MKLSEFTSLYEEVVLERVKVCAQQAFGLDVALRFDVQTVRSAMADELITTLFTEFAGKSDTILDEKYPATWVEAVKERWLPAWLKAKFPVSFKTIEVKRHTVFPSIEIPHHCGKVFVEVIRKPGLLSF